MNNFRLLSRGPAQRAASAISNTLNGVAADVQQVHATLDELAARENKSLEPVPGAEVESVALAAPLQQNASPAAASQGTAVQHPPTVASPALPQIPNLRPQLEAFANAIIRNQQETIGVLHDFRKLVDAQAAELARLKEHIKGQQTVMSNMRRWG